MLDKYIENPLLKNIAEWLLSIGIAFVAYLVISNFIFGTANISGVSMEPTLEDGEKVIINKFTYLFSEPRLGDIVAFPYRENTNENYVKRVVGLPGDIIDLMDDKITVNGVLPDDVFSEEEINMLGNIEYPFTVPQGRYFVLGDNRNHSNDSRLTSVGCISKAEMIGKISIRVLPFSKFGFVK